MVYYMAAAKVTMTKIESGLDEHLHGSLGLIRSILCVTNADILV